MREQTERQRVIPVHIYLVMTYLVSESNTNLYEQARILTKCITFLSAFLHILL
jgi:hypothetical protein